MLKLPNLKQYKHTFHRRNKQFSRKVGVYSWGNIGLMTLGNGYVTSKQFQTLWKYLKRNAKKRTQLWYNVHAQHAITKKPQESRMGKGNGPIKYWSTSVGLNRCLVQLKGIYPKKFSNVLSKLPIKVIWTSKL